MTRTTKTPQQRIAIWLTLSILTVCLTACTRSSPEQTVEASANPPAVEPATTSEGPEPTSLDDPFWDGLARNSIQLDQTLLVVKGSKGVAGCTYLNVDTFERAGEACVILPAADFAGMLDAKVAAATSQAKALGIEVGMPGREALERLR